VLERFSFECRKVIGFALTTLRDWFKKLAPLFHPIRSKTKTNRDPLVRVFPRFASPTCDDFVFLRVLIGSLDYLCPLWLARVITLVLVLRHSIENRSNASMSDSLITTSGYGLSNIDPAWKPCILGEVLSMSTIVIYTCLLWYHPYMSSISERGMCLLNRPISKFSLKQ